MDSALTVLLAEDNPDEALLMQRAFKLAGLQRPPHIVQDGLAAIAYLAGEGIYGDRTTYPFPDVVIVDLKMPKATGFDVLQWQKDHPEFAVIPTLVWSSSSDVRDVKRAYCMGANGYLVKPVDFQEFKVMVTDIFRFWDRCLKPAPDSRPSCSELEDAHSAAASEVLPP